MTLIYLREACDYQAGPEDPDPEMINDQHMFHLVLRIFGARLRSPGALLYGSLSRGLGALHQGRLHKLLGIVACHHLGSISLTRAYVFVPELVESSPVVQKIFIRLPTVVCFDELGVSNSSLRWACFELKIRHV